MGPSPFYFFFPLAKHIHFVILPKHLAAPYPQHVCLLPNLWCIYLCSPSGREERAINIIEGRRTEVDESVCTPTHSKQHSQTKLAPGKLTRLNIVKMRHWPWKCSVCRFFESGQCHIFTVGLTCAKHCRCTPMLQPHQCSSGSVGTLKSCCRPDKGVIFLLHICTCTPSADSLLGTVSSCPLPAPRVLGGQGMARNYLLWFHLLLRMAKMTQLELPS